MKLWSAWAGFLFLVCACSNSVDSGTTERLDSTSIKPAVTEPLDTSTTETSVKTADISPTIGTDETVNDFELTVTAPALVTSYFWKEQMFALRLEAGIAVAALVLSGLEALYTGLLGVSFSDNAWEAIGVVVAFFLALGALFAAFML